MSRKNFYLLGLILIIIGLASLACFSSAAPETQAPPPPPNTDPGAIDTQIAAEVLTIEAANAGDDTAAVQTVAAALTQTAIVVAEDLALETMVAQTLTAGAVQQASPTQTPPPPTSTFTPTVTQTSTAIPTPTFAPGDPATTLGEPNFREEFNTETNWSPYETSNSRAEISGGKFIFTKKVLELGTRWTVSWPTIEDYYIEVSAQTPNICAGTDRYGIIFRAPDPSSGYIFTLTCDGRYRLWSWDGSDTVILVDWTSHSAINAGGNQINRLGVWVVGNTIKLYANGVELTTLTDNQFIGEYRYGLAIGSGETEPFTVIFDNLMYWELP